MGKGGGCCQCCQCGGKFEAYDAEEFADGCSDDEPDYDTCPDCLTKAARDEEKDNEIETMREENRRLKAGGAGHAVAAPGKELQELRERNVELVAALDSTNADL